MQIVGRPEQAIVLAFAVAHVAYDRTCDVLEVAADLVQASRTRPQLDQGVASIGRTTAKLGNRSDPLVTALALAMQNGIVYEVCPTSNIQTATIDDVAELNLKELLDKGAIVTLNTDDPGISDTTLTDEYLKVQEVFNLTRDDLERLLMNGVDAAFADDNVKSSLRQTVQTYFTA